jgi:hypothetical protein
MNLQICFMNETSSDTESVLSQDGNEALSPIKSLHFQSNSSPSSLLSGSTVVSPYDSNILLSSTRPQVLSLPPLRFDTTLTDGPLDEADFFTRQARLQIEARVALAQAKEMAHMQMKIERQKLKQNPITEMVRDSLHKVREVGLFIIKRIAVAKISCYKSYDRPKNPERDSRGNK